MDDPRSLAKRVEEVLLALKRSEGAACPDCARALCGHHALFSLVLGYGDAPRCLPCLAEDLGRERDLLRDEMSAYIFSKECLTMGWAWSNLREGIPALAQPACLGGGGAAVTPRPAATWDAGNLGCGDLVLELRTRLKALKPGEVLRLLARDPGAPEDLPAWCSMTGHTLLKASHPEYLIQRKEN